MLLVLRKKNPVFGNKPGGVGVRSTPYLLTLHDVLGTCAPYPWYKNSYFLDDDAWFCLAWLGCPWLPLAYTAYVLLMYIYISVLTWPTNM